MRNKKINIYFYFLIVLILYLAFELLTNVSLGPIVSVVKQSKYGAYIISEICWLSLVLFAIFLFKDGKIFGESKEGFFKTLIICFPLTFLGVIYTIANIRHLFGVPIINVFGVALYALSIGLTEELLVRGWVLSRFFKKYSTKRKEVYLSIFFSALIFGGMHITNIWNGGQTVSETLIQILFATAAGIFFGAAYFRTKNILGVAFVHGFYDFSILIGEISLLRDCTSNAVSSITKYSLFNTVCESIIFVLAALVIMRKSKTNPLFGEEVTAVQEAKDQEFKTRAIIACIVIYFIANNVPYSFFGVTDKDLRNFKVCYSYPEIDLNSVTTTYNNYNSYSLSNENTKYEFYTKNRKKAIDLYFKVNGKEYKFVKDILDYKIVVNNDIYTVYYLVPEENSNNSTIYYSKFLEKQSLSAEKDYIDNFKKSFTSQGMPPSNVLGAIKEDGYDYIFPLIKDYNNNLFMIDEENIVRKIVIDKTSRSDLIINYEKALIEKLEKELPSTIPFLDFKNPEYLDAYRGTDIILDNIELKNLLNNAYRLSKQDKLEIPIYSMSCPLNNPCLGEAYVDSSELINKLKSIYNKELVDITSFATTNGIVEQHDNYWVYIKTEDNPVIEKLSHIEESYFEGKDFIIEEKAGFIYNDTLSKYSDIDNSIIINNSDNKALKDYFQNNKDKFSTFVHTFKYDETTNNYYYYSTQVK